MTENISVEGRAGVEGLFGGQTPFLTESTRSLLAARQQRAQQGRQRQSKDEAEGGTDRPLFVLPYQYSHYPWLPFYRGN